MPGILGRLLEVAVPSACRSCRRPLRADGSRGGVCAACWGTVAAHAEGLCPTCGAPGLVGPGECLACRTSPPAWDHAATFGPYGGTLRELVLLLKNHGCDELAAPLAGLLEATFRGTSWGLPEVVVPVPTPWQRRLRRGYNQAELLSRALAGRLPARHLDVLRRVSAATQRGRGRRARLALPASAFPCRAAVAGRALLVDDVVTTGATAAACARSLRSAGASEVLVLALARAPGPGSNR